MWHRNEGELWLPPPDAPEDPPPGVFPGDRGLALNKTPTRVGVYSFAAGFDLGASTRVTMTGYVQGHGAKLGVVMAHWVPLASAQPLAMGNSAAMSNWRPLASAVPLALNTSAEWDAHIETRVSVDGETWGDWFPLKSTVITAQKFEWRMVGSIYDLLTTLEAEEAGVLIEVPLRSVQGNDAPLDGTGHLTVTYAVPFLATPTVQLTARQSVAPGGNIVLIDSDARALRGRAPRRDRRPARGRQHRLLRPGLRRPCMSQYDFGNIDPYVVDGVQLAGSLNQWRDALYARHRGALRPSYVVPGLDWLSDAAGAAGWVWNFYSGPTKGDLPLFNIDTVAGLVALGAGMQAVTTDPADATPAVATTEFVQAAIQAALQNVVGLTFPTGTIVDLVGSLAAAPTGWVLGINGTIGDAGSGATIRANADCHKLFVHLWNGLSDADAPVTGGRGATAESDWAAKKIIGGLDYPRRRARDPRQPGRRGSEPAGRAAARSDRGRAEPRAERSRDALPHALGLRPRPRPRHPRSRRGRLRLGRLPAGRQSRQHRAPHRGLGHRACRSTSRAATRLTITASRPALSRR